MRALWLEDRALVLRDDVPLPQPQPGEARIRVLLAGICNTDLELVRGYYPFAGVPGHEFVGRVEHAPGHPQWEGRRVVGEINACCGSCAECAVNRRAHCAHRTVLGIRGRNGALAEALTLPLENLHEVPQALSDEQAVFVEPLAAALEVQEQVPIDARQRVVVLGDGKLGNLVAQTLALTGCELRVIGRHASKRALLEARGIATADESGLPVRWADVAVECSGSPEGFDLARRAVRPRGTVVLKSTYHGEARINLSAVVVDELTLVGSRCGPFAAALKLLAAGTVDVRPLITTRRPLSDGLAAFAESARPAVLKVLVDCR